jgi:diketogulonate reductase-like aldo/keto reductase
MRQSELTPIHGCDVKVSKLSLGTAPLGGLFKKVAESESDSVIREALDAGIAYIDTAPLYGYGVGEIRVGRGIKLGVCSVLERIQSTINFQILIPILKSTLITALPASVAHWKRVCSV